jgi:hypothetical protein
MSVALIITPQTALSLQNIRVSVFIHIRRHTLAVLHLLLMTTHSELTIPIQADGI